MALLPLVMNNKVWREYLVESTVQNTAQNTVQSTVQNTVQESTVQGTVKSTVCTEYRAQQPTLLHQINMARRSNKIQPAMLITGTTNTDAQ